jgi:hypothetical protein
MLSLKIDSVHYVDLVKVSVTAVSLDTMTIFLEQHHVDDDDQASLA